MTASLSADTTHDVRLDISVDEDNWSGAYDRIEVWRSVFGEAGPYEEITASSWKPARLPADGGDPSALSGALANIVDQSLSVLVGEDTELSWTFTGANPLTFVLAATQVSAAFLPHVKAHVDNKGKFVIETGLVGATQRLEVLSSAAAPLLGLTVGDVAYGADPRIPLVKGKSKYLFRDYFGKKTYFYKTRFSNSLTSARSDFSAPISAVSRGGVSPENLVVGYVRLAQRGGKPDVKKAVAIFAPVLGFQVDGSTISGGQEEFLTDDQGYVEVTLVRGMEIDLSIAGTSLMRRITVPTDPAVERFDMLSPEYGTDDAFTVKRLDIPFAERRNL